MEAPSKTIPAIVVLRGVLGPLAQMLGMAEGATDSALAPMLAQLEEAGVGDRVRSWTGGVAPLPIEPHELSCAFTLQQVKAWAMQSGTTPHDVLAHLSNHLRTAVIHAGGRRRVHCAPFELDADEPSRIVKQHPVKPACINQL